MADLLSSNGTALGTTSSGLAASKIALFRARASMACCSGVSGASGCLDFVGCAGSLVIPAARAIRSNLASIRLQEEKEKIRIGRERNKVARMDEALNESQKFCNSDQLLILKVWSEMEIRQRVRG